MLGLDSVDLELSSDDLTKEVVHMHMYILHVAAALRIGILMQCEDIYIRFHNAIDDTVI